MPLILCPKPTNLDEQYVGECITFRDHRFLGRYDLDGQYYVHHLCCDKWYKLVEKGDKTMDKDLMGTFRSIEEVRRAAYEAGHKAGYARGLIDGRIEGLHRNQEIVHELIGDKNDDRKTD